MKIMILTLITLALTWALTGAAGDKERSIDFTTPLIGTTGQPIKLSDAKDAKDTTPMTLGDAAYFALDAMTESDKNVSGPEKMRRNKLGRKIYGQKTMVLTVEEIALIKERIGVVFAPAVVGATWPLLDPAEK